MTQVYDHNSRPTVARLISFVMDWHPEFTPSEVYEATLGQLKGCMSRPSDATIRNLVAYIMEE